jgi:aspartyl aminopeptidase
MKDLNMNNSEFANRLLNFIYCSPTPYHAVKYTKNILLKNSFLELDLAKGWDIKESGKYFVTKNDSSLIAFVAGNNTSDFGFRIVGAHTDSPALKIKPNPELLSEGYLKLNTEVYASPILSTWFDRPLAIAGRVMVKNSNPFEPEMRLININRPLAIIPNIAIHMSRDVNKGIAIDYQKDLLPIIQTTSKDFEKENYLLKLITETLKVDISDILDFDIFLYEFEKGAIIGAENEFISSPRLDNLEAVHAGIHAIINSSHNEKTINVMACFDNEEVGSSTKQGADSQLLSNILERIILNLGGNRDDFLKAVSNSFMISVDGAHAIHPNKPEKSDITNRPLINKGPVIKVSANQKYTSDAESTAIYKAIADNAEVPCQMFVSHSNEKGGSTIGPISSSHLELRSVDIGIPFLAMHSCRELCGVKDHYSIMKTIKAMYEI